MIIPDLPTYSEAPNFAPQVGVWEVRISNFPGRFKVNRQVILNQPVDWCGGSIPTNMGGNYNWWGNINITG